MTYRRKCLKCGREIRMNHTCYVCQIEEAEARKHQDRLSRVVKAAMRPRGQ